MKRSTWFLLALLATAITLLVIWRAQAKPVEAVKVIRDTITQSVVATGRIAPAARIDIGSLTTANIKQIHVYEGDHVTAGQRLVTLTDSAIEASYEQAKASLVEAAQRKEELDSLTRPLAQRALAQAQANLALAKSDYQRNRELSNKNMLAQTTLDQAKRNMDINQIAFDSAQLQLEASKERGSSSNLIQARWEQAKAALALAQAKVDQLTITTPVEGTIISRTAEVGATAQVGKALFTLASSGETRIELPIDEKSIRYLKPNQAATVIADAYPKQPFSAHLSLIYPSVDAARATVNVRLIVDNPPAFLKPDMTVSVEMRTDSASNAQILPTDAIHDPDSDQPWVVVIRDGLAEQQPITTGIRGIGDTQVLSGLNDGDWVVTQTGVKLGSRAAPTNRVTAAPRGFDVPTGFK